MKYHLAFNLRFVMAINFSLNELMHVIKKNTTAALIREANLKTRTIGERQTKHLGLKQRNGVN